MGRKEGENASEKRIILMNALAKEKSPYLLQHRQNPVNWYPWGEEAFEKPKKRINPSF